MWEMTCTLNRQENVGNKGDAHYTVVTVISVFGAWLVGHDERSLRLRSELHGRLPCRSALLVRVPFLFVISIWHSGVVLSLYLCASSLQLHLARCGDNDWLRR